MTKKKYLARLRKHLQFKLSNSEIDDILSDIEECFEAGAAEGKSEEEICLSLGEPKNAAASLLNEQTGGERVTKLAEIWLPVVISAVLFAVYTYCGFMEATDHYRDYVLPIMYVLPLIMWVLFERKGFFTALADYKCDFFTFIGSVFMIAAGFACDELPKRTFLKSPLAADTNMLTYTVLTVVFISLAMILLAVSLWKNAPKLFAAVPLVGIIFTVYNSVVLVRAYRIWSGNPNELFGITAGGYIGESFLNILVIIFVCASAFLLWSFIHRNALTLASAYSAMTVTGFMFYWYFTLATIDPTQKGSIAYLRHMCSGRNYLIWGVVVSLAVFIITFAVKLAKRISGKRAADMEKGQMKKGVLEMCILQVVASGELYGYEIMKKVTNAFPDLNESTVYAILRRLHADGCTDSYKGETSGGPTRKYYRITDTGRERLEKMKAEWNEILCAIISFGV